MDKVISVQRPLNFPHLGHVFPLPSHWFRRGGGSNGSINVLGWSLGASGWLVKVLVNLGSMANLEWWVWAWMVGWCDFGDFFGILTTLRGTKWLNSVGSRSTLQERRKQKWAQKGQKLTFIGSWPTTCICASSATCINVSSYKLSLFPMKIGWGYLLLALMWVVKFGTFWGSSATTRINASSPSYYSHKCV